MCIRDRARAEERGLPGGGRSSEPESAQSSKDRVLDVLRGLAEERRNRFLRLRARCVEMQRIANAATGPRTPPGYRPAPGPR